MRLIKLFFILLSLLMINGIALGEGISVSQSLGKSSIPFESNTTFEIKLQWDGPQWAYRFDKPLNPTFDRLKVGEFTSSISSQGSGDNEISVKTYRYTLIPTSAGKGTIDPVNIPYVSVPDSIPGELVTEPMTIMIMEPVPVKESNWSNTVIIILCVAIILIAIVVFLIIRFNQKGKKEVVKSPKDKALEDLGNLKNNAGNDMKKFQTGLYQLLKDYVMTEYSINIETLSDEELIKSIMECGLSKSDGEKLSGWIIKAKQDKFRPVVSAPGDTIRLETEIRNYFSNV